MAIADMPARELYGFLTSAVVPRPIAFASTIDSAGNVNLSPFSYFNMFSSNPPVLVFSPVRRSADGTVKDTLHNIAEVPEVVINLVNYRLVHQMSLASAGYPRGVNEFRKAGLTEEASVAVRPPRVGESPVSFECRVTQTVELGREGGAGTLIICEVVHVHVEEKLLMPDGRIDPFHLDAVARLGGNWYARVDEHALFEVHKPGSVPGVGVDALPGHLSMHFTAGELALLAGVDKIPDQEPAAYLEEDKLNLVRAYLKEGDIHAAWNHLTRK